MVPRTLNPSMDGTRLMKPCPFLPHCRLLVAARRGESVLFRKVASDRLSMRQEMVYAMHTRDCSVWTPCVRDRNGERQSRETETRNEYKIRRED